MNFFDNEYALPVVLGDGSKAIEIANLIRKNTNLEIHLFSHKVSLWNKLKFKTHKLSSDKEDISLLKLTVLAECLHESFTPILIYCDDELGFVEKHFDELESMYVIISANTAKNFLQKAKDNETK